MTTINLATIDPRDYLHEIERQLIEHGYSAVAQAMRAALPRDLMEMFVLLPDDVEIKLWEATNGAT